METKLPKIQDLYSKDIAELQKDNELNVLLNQPPKGNWVKEHPFAHNVRYLPIERIEYLLTAIFINWSVEVKQIQMIANSVVVTVRLHYRHPRRDEMLFQDGIGASPIQTEKGAAATDFTKVLNDAVMKAAPAAESYAIKDAAEKLGKLFGKDLNRKDEIVYDSLMNKFDLTNKYRTLLSTKIGECQDPEITEKVMSEALAAEDAGTNNAEFYKQLLEKYFNHEDTN